MESIRLIIRCGEGGGLFVWYHGSLGTAPLERRPTTARRGRLRWSVALPRLGWGRLGGDGSAGASPYHDSAGTARREPRPTGEGEWLRWSVALPRRAPRPTTFASSVLKHDSHDLAICCSSASSSGVIGLKFLPASIALSRRSRNDGGIPVTTPGVASQHCGRQSQGNRRFNLPAPNIGPLFMGRLDEQPGAIQLAARKVEKAVVLQ
jgi:hypothetical protein